MILSLQSLEKIVSGWYAPRLFPLTPRLQPGAGKRSRLRNCFNSFSPEIQKLQKLLARTYALPAHTDESPLSMRSGRKVHGLCRLTLLFVFFALPSTVSAHRLNEYLQATLVTIEPGEIRLQVNLTPGVAVAEKVLALIDRDHDGLISTNEAAAYAHLLKRDLTVQLDGQKLAMKLAASNFAPPAELRTGWGIIQLEFSATTGLPAPGHHRLTVENRHLPALSVYLVNATQPRSGSSVEIMAQKRNKNQSTGEIEFSIVRQG